MHTADQDEFKHIAIELLKRGEYQPRIDFNQEALQELADSIFEQGVIEPLIVRPLNHKEYEIIAGERRWRASTLAGLDRVPCVIRHYSDEEAAEVTLIENIQRENLNPIEEAQALNRLLENFQFTHEDIAKAIGKSRTRVTNILRLLHLDIRVQQLLINKELSEGHGKMLAGLPSHQQVELAQQCIKEAWSVRKMEKEVKDSKQPSSATTAADANIRHLERKVSERFNAEVKLEDNSSQRSGWIKVKYYDYDTLNDILDKMGVKSEE